MSRDPRRLVRCIEEVMLRIPSGAENVVPLSFEGVRGRRTPLPTPYTNLVGVAGPGAEVPDASIDAVLDEFRGRGAAFGWLVGPHSPPDLATRLQERGMARAEEFAGLALTDLDRHIPSSDRVTVRQVDKREQELFDDLLSRAFGMPAELTAFLSELLYFADSEVRARNYVAHLDGGPEPVAAASTLYDPTAAIAVLAGSAVLPAHRGQGIYRTLVHRRLQDARHDGIEAAVIQAVRATSAPICRKLGFEEVCAQELYAWGPGSEIG